MKRLITIILLFFSLVSIGQNELHIDKTFVRSKAYKDRFIPDGGTMLSDRLTKAYMLMAEKHGMADNIEFGWMSGGASNKRVAGINQFYTNLYDFYGTNDAAQTTELNQPYVSGNIAPNEVEALKNPNGDERYLTHPEISFSATDEWSVTTVLNWNGTERNINEIYGKEGLGAFRVKNSTNVIRLVNDSISGVSGSLSTLGLIGKNSVITLTASGDGNLHIYIDGVFFETLVIGTNFTFSNLFFGRTKNDSHKGTISAHIIRSQTLTPEQVAAEHNLLREIYPEIPSVKIGDQTWSTSNLEMVATPEGNVIVNVTEGSNVEQATGGDMETDSNSDGLADGQSVWGASPSGWETSRVTGNGFSGYAQRLDGEGYIALNSAYIYINKLYRVEFKYRSSHLIQFQNAGSGSYNEYDANSGTAISVVFYFIADRSGQHQIRVRASIGTVTWLEVDDFWIQEVGWSDIDDMFTELTTNQGYTDYEAYKECAAWCYYNNDPSIGAVYGKLYNWYAAKLLDLDMASSGYGWRVPTQTDFNTLATTLGGTSVAGGKMKVSGIDYWNSPNTGATNESRFSALPGGDRQSNGTFRLKNSYAMFWTTLENVRATLVNNTSELSFTGQSYTYGQSIRLIKE